MTEVAPLSCQEVVELVTEYLEGALGAPERLAFERHVAICPPCRAYFGQSRQTVRLGHALSAEELPPSLRVALADAFRDWARGDPDGVPPP